MAATSMWLECWGPGWEWHDCVGVGAPNTHWGNVTLSPITLQRVELTWTANKNPKKFPGKKFSGPLQQSTSKPSVDVIGNLDPTEVTATDSSGTGVRGTGRTMTPLRNDSRFKGPDDDVFGPGHLQPKYVAARVPSGSSLIIEDVAPRQVYQIQLQPHLGTNMTSIYFKLQDNHTWEGWPEPDPGGGASHNPPISSTLGNVRQGPAGNAFVRVEEISLIILVLALWIVAILLFVHRWGKIRMLEPYQPEYKPITAPSTPPGSILTGPTIGSCLGPPGLYPVAPSTYRGPPRKSSSLCFTPSMFSNRTPYRGTLTHQHSTTSRCSLPASSRYMATASGRHRALRVRSDSMTHHRPTVTSHIYQPQHHHHSFCRKARSAENLRNFRMSFNHSFEDPRETCSSSNIVFGSGFGVKLGCPGSSAAVTMAAEKDVTAPSMVVGSGAKHKWGRCVNSSLESCRGASLPITAAHDSRTPLLIETGVRGRSLDSACASSARRLADGRVTPELRVSPPPPTPKEPLSPRPHTSKVYFSYMNMYGSTPSSSSAGKEAGLTRSSSGFSHGRQFGLQRQEPIEETLFPPHYPTLVEEQEDEPLSCSSGDNLDESISSASGFTPAAREISNFGGLSGHGTTTTALIASPPSLSLCHDPTLMAPRAEVETDAEQVSSESGQSEVGEASGRGSHDVRPSNTTEVGKTTLDTQV